MGMVNRQPAGGPPELPALLSEFRTALQDEIEAAKRHASNSSLPLSNGHRVGQQGAAFQYAFIIDSVLNAPDDAPGDLIVPGSPPMPATIVSVEGLRIVISVECDLGQFVPNARLQTNLAYLMRKLIERIEVRAPETNPAGRRMLGIEPVSGTPVDLGNHTKLKGGQERALRSALGRDLTVIWGPPGTGKTYTIGTIVEHLFKSSRTVLVVSHTNTAVDQAIKHVAKALPQAVSEGKVVRVGQVRDEELKTDHADVLIKRQVELQSRHLVRQQEVLLSQMSVLSNELSRLQEQIAMAEWVEMIKTVIRSHERTFSEVRTLQLQVIEEVRVLDKLQAEHENLVRLHRVTSRILSLRKSLAAKREQQNSLSGSLSSLALQAAPAKQKLVEQQHTLELANRIAPLRSEMATHPPVSLQRGAVGGLTAELVDLEERLVSAKSQLDAAAALLAQSSALSFLGRTFRGLPNPQDQKAVVTDLAKRVASLEAQKVALQEALQAATTKLGRILDLDAQLKPHEKIGTQLQESIKVVEAQKALKRIEDARLNTEQQLAGIRAQIEDLQLQEYQQAADLPVEAKDIYVEVCSKLQLIKELPDSIRSHRARIDHLNQQALPGLNRMLRQAQHWTTVQSNATSAPEILEALLECRTQLVSQVDSLDLPVLRERSEGMRRALTEAKAAIEDMERRLNQVERLVVMNASVLGATLTKAYLSDDIQARKFDTVILDEASMAPIPALWAAALLAERNLVIVGDFKQLPPIVLSNNQPAKQWLGRDVFEASGLKAHWENKTPPDYFIPLTEQRRMLPDIAEIANKFFYDEILVPSTDLPGGFDDFNKWYQRDWPHDSPVLLVDTGPLHAWVTSVEKGGNTSRLNFLSATAAVDLAEQLLRPGRNNRSDGAARRIMIVAPYRAHAKLVNLLIRENKVLNTDVTAGTAHSFQGSEADAVIFDLVVDEPHFRVNLFIPSLDDQLKRLFNVALTRARFRLILMGDFSYCLKLGKHAFLGRELLPFLCNRFPIVSALDVIPNGLASRASKAQMTMLGGHVEVSSDRVVVTQESFFHLLSTDIEEAQHRIIIYSPFMTPDRIAILLPHLQAAAARGLFVFVITKSRSERSRSELSSARQMEAQLTEIGATVIHKMRMHEKLVFIDHDLLWSGSLNPLSFSNTQEVMERRRNRAVFDDYTQVLRVEELVRVQQSPEAKCPICGSEMIAAEGRDEPYYWRCIDDDCYTRSIDQPYPFDGLISCSSCGQPVDFGYWGDYPHWRCTANSRHRQRISKSHLRLPKMTALIPSSERRKVFKILGLANKNLTVEELQRRQVGRQLSLFDYLDEPSD